jgi:hypothetical protein
MAREGKLARRASGTKDKGKVSPLSNPLNRWKVAVVVGALVVAGTFFGFTRAAESGLTALETELDGAKAQAAALSSEIDAVATNNNDDLDAVRAKVESLDRLLPYYKAGTTDTLSNIFLDVSALVESQMSEAVSGLAVDGLSSSASETQACSQLTSDPLSFTEVSNASDLNQEAPQTAAGPDAGSARWIVRISIADPVVYSDEEAARCAATGENPRTWDQMSAHAFAAVNAAVKSLEDIEPLFVVTKLKVQSPLPPSVTGTSETLSEPLFIVEVTGETYVATKPGLAQVVPAPIPMISIPGFELVVDVANGVSPGVASFQNADGQVLRLSVLPPGVLQPPGAYVVRVKAPDDVLTGSVDGAVDVAIEVSGQLPIPLSEFAEQIEIKSFAKTQQQLLQDQTPGSGP